MWIYVYFVFALRRYLFIFIHDQLGAYVIRGLLDLIAADAERSQILTGVSSQSQDSLNNLRWKSYTVSWRTSGWKWAGPETSVEKQKNASLHPPAAARNYVLGLIYRADYLTRLIWCESDISRLWGHVPSLLHQRTICYSSCKAQGPKLAYIQKYQQCFQNLWLFLVFMFGRSS